MKTRHQEILYTLIGASGGFAGMIPFTRCHGNCIACLGCAGIGLGVVVLLIAQNIRSGKKRSDGKGVKN
jgi:hypothetical protein